MLTYTNKRGKKVELEITRHAYSKFIERYLIAYPKSKLLTEEVGDRFNHIFKNTSKVKNLSRQEKTRLKRHGDDTMFFRTNKFTFIVKNAKVITVELSDVNMRHLN